MESVEWMFSEHKLHLSMLQLLREEQALFSNEIKDNTVRDDEISGMILSPPPLDGMPHAHSTGGSTEWAVMKLNMINQDRQTLSNEIQKYCQILRLYDAVMRTLNEDERWFVENHYEKEQSLSSLPLLPNSPVRDLSRSTMSNYRKRLLEKATNFFMHVKEIGS